MLNPRPLNSPAMRVSTPNLFSTSTEIVCRMSPSIRPTAFDTFGAFGNEFRGFLGTQCTHCLARLPHLRIAQVGQFLAQVHLVIRLTTSGEDSNALFACLD